MLRRFVVCRKPRSFDKNEFYAFDDGSMPFHFREKPASAEHLEVNAQMEILGQRSMEIVALLLPILRTHRLELGGTARAGSCGVAWRGVAWRGVAWRGVAWRGMPFRMLSWAPERIGHWRLADSVDLAGHRIAPRSR